MRSTFALATALFLVACGGKAGLPQCHWPAELSADASTPHCAAARALVSCDLGGGVTEEGLSDDPSRCSGGSAGQSQCADDEYAAACGAPGPARAPDPPAGCRAKFLTPANTALFCCPCL
jgi:hypothetical protein